MCLLPAVPNSPSSYHRHLLAALFVAAISSPLTAFATTRSYIGGDNSAFATSTNWNPNGTPGAGDILTVGDNVVSGLTGDLHVTINGLFLNLTSVTFDSVALPNALVLNETGGTISATTEVLGNIAFGNTYNQTQGSANIASTLTIAATVASHDDFYNISGNGTSLTVTSTLNLGLAGDGNISQSDGVVSIHNSSANAFLLIGENSGSSGNYSLSGGNLTVDLLRVGLSGNAGFTQSGGNISSASAIVAANAATAVYNYTAGNATFAGGLTIGNNGTFNLQNGASLPFTVNVQSGGNFTTAATATLGSTGKINQTGGSININGNLTVNGGSINQTTGAFNWTGNHTMTIQSAGNVTLSGIYSTPASANIIVTGAGSQFNDTGANADLSINNGATLSVTAGASVHSDQFLDIASSGNGTVTVSGLGSSLSTATANGENFLGTIGTGSLTFSSHATGNVTNGFQIGAANGSSGTLNIQSSASLTTTAMDIATSSTSCVGAVTVTGGNLTQTSGAFLNIGAPSLSSATLTIGTAGSFTTSTGLTDIRATGKLILQAGGSITFNGNVNNSGNLTLSGNQTWVNTTLTNNSSGKTAFNTNAKLFGLTINGGTVDLTSAKIIVEAATGKSATLAALRSNMNAQTLTSSTLTPNQTLAISDNAVAGFASFGGNPADANSILIVGTYLGDANLDGKVDILDLTAIANHWQTNQSDWFAGDLDNSGFVDILDLTDVANNWQAGVTPQFSTLTTPEPASLALVLPALFLLKKRRR